MPRSLQSVGLYADEICRVEEPATVGLVTNLGVTCCYQVGDGPHTSSLQDARGESAGGGSTARRVLPCDPDWLHIECRDRECAVVGTVVKKVLVVDDDESIRETLRTVLEEAGYVVDEAPDGMGALKRVTQQS